jgi:formylglycine-generating enzyme
MKHIWVFAGLLPLVVSGCTAEWIIPKDYYVECESNDDCPDSAQCRETQDGTSVCVTNGRAECGNGVQETGEKCDEGSSNTNDYQLTQTCLSDCSGYGSYCGDGIQDDAEACDDGNTLLDGITDQNPDGNGCSATCTQLGSCGDGQVQYAFEDCDDGNTEVQTCLYGQESCYVCNGVCALEAGATAFCGDGITQPDNGEVCDSDTRTCTALSSVFASGNSTCVECSQWDTAECEADITDPEKMVQLPGGLFWQGCNYGTGIGQDDECFTKEVPYHQTQIDEFFMDTYEVTVAQYRACVNAGVCSDEEVSYDPSMNICNYGYSDRENHPINCVVWAEAQTYCAWAQKRLPTEAEWEKAARGTDGRKYPWGNSPDVSCTHAVMYEGGTGCGQGRTWEVGSKPLGVSPYGAHDMIGNVYEWTADWYGSNYYCAGNSATYNTPYEHCGLNSSVSSDVTTNPQGLSDGVERGLRGGSFIDDDLVRFRAAFRASYGPGYRFGSFGFRCSQ